MSPPALTHADPTAPDDRLASEAAAHLARHPALQLIAELLTRLREVGFPWWTPEHLRGAYPAAERMRWLVRRPDIRQRITTQLTGLAPRAARNKTPEFQAALIDSVIDEGDITREVFEQAFEPTDIAVYGPASDLWRLFRKRMPWDDDATAHQDLVGWLIGALLADKCSLDGAPRTPVLSALQVRTAIDGRVWHSRIPLHVRVAIDDARFAHQRERPTEAFGVERDLQIATPALIAASVPLKDLGGVLDVAGLALGFEDGQPPSRSFAREHSARPPAPAVESAEDVQNPSSLLRPRRRRRPGARSRTWPISSRALLGRATGTRARWRATRSPPPTRTSRQRGDWITSRRSSSTRTRGPSSRRRTRPKAGSRRKNDVTSRDLWRRRRAERSATLVRPRRRSRSRRRAARPSMSSLLAPRRVKLWSTRRRRTKLRRPPR